MGAPIRLSSWSYSKTSLASSGAQGERAFVGGLRRFRVVGVVERRKAEVAPHDRIGRVDLA